MEYVHQIYDGAILRRKRERLGLTQLQVAHHCNVSTTTVGYWENNVRNPRMSNLEPLRELLSLKLPGWVKATAKVQSDQLYRKKKLLTQQYDLELV